MPGQDRTRENASFSEAWQFGERRSRTTTESNPNPAYGNWSTRIENYPEYSPRRDYCQDVSGSRGTDNPLLISHEQSGAASLQAEFWISHHGGEPYGLERQWRLDYQIPVSAVVASTGPDTNDVEFVTKAAADVNPSAAEFDLPIFLAELRDVPSLLKNAAEKLSKGAANEYLKYQYGWKPLISDVRKLVAGMDKIDRIFNNLRKLRKDDVLRRRYEPTEGNRESISSDDFVELDYERPWGFGIDIRCHRKVEGYRKRWAILRFKADRPDGLPETDSELMALARRVAYGGKIDGSTMWELMPWSWLIDWNTNMSEYISSTRNIVGATLSDVTLMRETIATAHYTPEVFIPPGYDDTVEIIGQSSTPSFTRWICRERFVDVKPAAVVTGEVNLLKGNFTKQSILGALAVQRLRRLPF